MLGAMLGDIVGSVYEFNNTKNYNFKLFSSESSVTDDSILTAAVAQWAMEDPTFSHSKLEEYLVRFGHEFPNPQGGYGGMFSQWLFYPESMNGYAATQSEPLRRPYNSWGNGSAMRVSAVGWIFDSLEQTERVAGLSASITHNHPEGIKGAQAVAAAIYLARTGVDKKDIRDHITQRYGYQLVYDREELHRTYSWNSSCQGTVPQAIWAFLESEDFESALRLAVSLGGDSDTLACITGGIAEAFYKDIPAEFVQKALAILPVHLTAVLQQLSHTYYKECFDAYIAPLL